MEINVLVTCFSIIIILLLVVIIVLLVDRSKKKKALQHMATMVKDSQDMKNAFITNMTHEIRTPLNALVGFSEVLAMSDNLPMEERLVFAKEINDNKDALLHLVNSLMDFSSIESNTLEYTNSEVDVNALIEELCMKANRNEKNIKVEFADKLPQCHLWVDRQRIVQVLNNLLQNALKFTEQGNIFVGYRRLSNGKFYFFVADSGCGIDPESRKAIFDSFVKMNNNIRGTGLGLSIAKAIVEHYGGGIGVESKKDEGSTFYFTLPASMEYKKYGKF